MRALSTQVADFNGGHVIIVDNFSGDDSGKKIQSAIHAEGWSNWAQVLEMPKNGGYAYGNNAGIRHVFANSHCDYILLLNPDTLARENAISQLVNAMESNPKIGVAGSRLQNERGEIDCSAHRFPSPVGELVESARLGMLTKLLSSYEVTPALRDVAHCCDWVSGASMMIRRQVIDEIGFLDEGFFLYFEEVDFFKRLAKAGWQVWYEPKSVVMHIEGAATGIKAIKRRPAYWFNSRRRYFVKHYGVFGLLVADMLWCAGQASYKLRRMLHLGAQGASEDPPYLTFDMLWGDLKAAFSGELCNIKK